ncbi:MAG TPA: L-seryl-tRNA(Sec) selenium transferase [Thermoanaerobaculia bacterium]|nr:L-seryl-tRNA(Sec) selenium transferase [Thermoanaerobaculia bacterium]
MKATSPFRSIPSMERVLSSDEARRLIDQFGRESLKSAVSEVLSDIRLGNEESGGDIAEVLRAAERRLQNRFDSSLREIINGSGVIIHTNLGRSPIDPESWIAAGSLMSGYSNLEFDLVDGERGSRHEHISALASQLFGCEAALLVNNNAAAVMLVLSALARGREVIVSRGELVEIGGSFRIPEVIEQGGARLREVGTTNRTRAADFEKAITAETGAMLRVHQSNYQIVGFTESPGMEDLIEIAGRTHVPLVVDEGSGRVIDLSRYGFKREPLVSDLLAAGADVVTCSTDKLLGSLQGGLILGKRDLIQRCAKHPLMRAFRAGKESYAVITETLKVFLSGKHESRIPLYRMLSVPVDSLRARAEELAADGRGSVIDLRSMLGGGTTPTETMASIGVALNGDVVELQRALLRAPTPIVGRVIENRLCLDLRTINPSEDELLTQSLSTIVAATR